jgi:outer membrane receptor protein involved in Fe transport
MSFVRSFTLRRLALASTALAGIAFATPSFAAEGAEGEGDYAEIVVTARHREERSQEVPQSIAPRGDGR